MKLTLLLLSALLSVVMTGCGVTPLKPGRSTFVSSSGSTAIVEQSQNPKTSTTQVYKRTVTEPSVSPEPRVTTEEVTTVIGAAQKDTARELGAKLGALKGVVWVGVLVFLFGAASFVYPPLKVIVGASVTTSAVIALAGLAMIVLPTLIVGNELVIMGVAVGAAVLYWFSHRHGKLQGVVDSVKGAK